MQNPRNESWVPMTKPLRSQTSTKNNFPQSVVQKSHKEENILFSATSYESQILSQCINNTYSIPLVSIF